MGPRPFSRGYLREDADDRGGSGQLQWGHGLSAVDTSLCQIVKMPRCSLQWGHGLSAVDTKLKFG